MSHKMFQKLEKGLGTVLLLCCCMLFPGFSGNVHAAEYACEAQLPVKIEVSGDNIPGGKDYRVTLEALTPEAPVPEHTTLTRTGAGSMTFGPIRYTKPGDYSYRIRQITDGAERFTYDTVVYRVTVRITNGENGGLQAQIWAEREGSVGKTTDITFRNQYHAPGQQQEQRKSHHHSGSPVKLQIPKTGDGSPLAAWGALAALALGGILLCGSRIGQRREKSRSLG